MTLTKLNLDEERALLMDRVLQPGDIEHVKNIYIDHLGVNYVNSSQPRNIQ